jgi:hypothetical protein
MSQQNARLNTDLDNKLTSSYHDGTDWYMQTKAKDGAISSLGATTDAEATGNGTLIGIIKRIRTLFGGGLPAALSGNGNLKTAVSESLPAGTNNIGSVNVTQIPSIPAGTNTIGSVINKGNQLRETQVGTDQTVTWANSDAANTQKTVTFAKPSTPMSEYELVVYNPSAITDITVKIFNVETGLGSGDRDALLTVVNIPKAQALTGTTINTHIKLISGMFNGGACKLVLSNNTVLGASDGFSAYVRLREVI